MNLKQYLNIVDLLLSKRGYPVSIHDLPDQDFYAFFDEDMNAQEAFESAVELVEEMIANGDLPDWNDLASVEFSDSDL
jgi:hypothetical protein